MNDEEVRKPKGVEFLVIASRDFDEAEEQYMSRLHVNYRSMYARNAFRAGWQQGVLAGWSAHDDAATSMKDTPHGEPT